MLSCIGKSVATRLRGVAVALDEAIPGLTQCPVFGPQCKKGRDKLERLRWLGLEHMAYKENLKDLCLPSLENRR